MRHQVLRIEQKRDLDDAQLDQELEQIYGGGSGFR